MWYAAKATTYRHAYGSRIVSSSDPRAEEPRRVFLHLQSPVILIDVRKMDEPPRFGAMEFDTRSDALEAARLIGRPGRRVAIPVAPCPHGCRGQLDWVADMYHCGRCGDEWPHEEIRGYPIPK